MNSTMPILAIFDLDNTLLRGDSDYEMVNYLIDKNFVDEKYRQINEDYFNDYGDGNLNIDEFSKFSLKPFIGMTRVEIEKLVKDFYYSSLVSKINNTVLSILEGHRKKGHSILIASATNSLIVSYVSKMLGVDKFISSEVLFRSELCTGLIKKPHALGEGKLVLVKKFVEMTNYEFQNSFFYSDSINDLPLLSAVGYPIAINPDEKLMSVSNLKGWRVLEN